MQHKNFVFLWLCAVVVAVWPWLAASASGPTTCSDGPSICTSSNTCGSGNGSTCVVQIVRANLSNGQVSPIINNNATPLQEFCISQGTKVQWVTTDATSFSDIRFSDSNAFGKVSWGSDSVTSTTVTASTSTTGCWSFAVSSCTFTGSSCGYSDPKVVLQGSRKREPTAHSKKSQ